MSLSLTFQQLLDGPCGQYARSEIRAVPPTYHAHVSGKNNVKTFGLVRGVLENYLKASGYVLINFIKSLHH